MEACYARHQFDENLKSSKTCQGQTRPNQNKPADNQNWINTELRKKAKKTVQRGD